MGELLMRKKKELIRLLDQNHMDMLLLNGIVVLYLGFNPNKTM